MERTRTHFWLDLTQRNHCAQWQAWMVRCMTKRRHLSCTVVTLFCFCVISMLLVLPAKAAENIQLWVTVDWEGLSMEEDNLAAMRQFRKQFPEIPILHLINPAYFLQAGVDRTQLTQQIRSTFVPEDRVGLHLHPMRNLVEACGIRYQAQPSVADTDEECRENHCGYTVSLEYAYSQAELIQLVGCASDLLTAQGFQRPQYFRAGAWQSGPKLQAALEALHFVWDSSRIAPELLLTRWHQESGMIRLLSQLHSTSTPLEQPFALSSQLMEYPNNAALADYTSSQQLVQLFRQLLTTQKQVMVLGFHQETAADFLLPLELAIPHMKRLAAEHAVNIEWMH